MRAAHAAARVAYGLQHAHIGEEYEDQGERVDADEQQRRILPALQSQRKYLNLTVSISLSLAHLGIRIVYVQRETNAIVAIEECAKVLIGQQRCRSQGKADAPNEQQAQHNSAIKIKTKTI